MVLVRVIPEGAGGVIRRNLNDVLCRFAWVHGAEDVVRFALRRDVEPMEVEIGGIGKVIDQLQLDAVTRTDAQRRSDERAVEDPSPDALTGKIDFALFGCQRRPQHAVIGAKFDRFGKIRLRSDGSWPWQIDRGDQT